MAIWLFIGLWMVAILFTSSISAPPETAGSVWGLVKAKSGHVFVYAVLGWSLFGALTSPRAGFGLGSRLALVVTVALFAALDETRQSFVYGRTALPTDVLLDTASALAGALLHQRQARGGRFESPGHEAANQPAQQGPAERERQELHREHLAVAVDVRQAQHQVLPGRSS
ncbi:MAG: VanZ family protein [Chloroflexota bacterium]|nr:VanZ family protein [Chloroflexota bacterium]